MNIKHGRRRRGRGRGRGGRPGYQGRSGGNDDSGGHYDRGGQHGGNAPVSTERVGNRGGGVLDVNPDGYGFLRSIERNFEPSPDDLFVPTSLVRRFNMRRGCYVEGPIGPPRGRGGNLAIDKIDLVDALDPEHAASRPSYKDLLTIDPLELFQLEDGSGDLSLRVLDLLCPVGRGQRGLITAPPRTGKTILLQKIARRIMEGYPEVHLMVLLIDERPEEATDFTRVVTHGEVIYSTNDEPASHGIRVAELAFERAKRLMESGRDVFILLDSLTRLGRNYNVEVKASGRTLSGGIDARTMEKPRALFGAARNVENGGSLTIMATALVETGSRMDEVIFEEFKGTGNMELVLSRKLAEQRIWPAIDINKSGTRREEKLVDAGVLDRMWTLRRVLNKMHPAEGMETLLKKLEQTATNAEFLSKFIVRE